MSSNFYLLAKLNINRRSKILHHKIRASECTQYSSKFYIWFHWIYHSENSPYIHDDEQPNNNQLNVLDRYYLGWDGMRYLILLVTTIFTCFAINQFEWLLRKWKINSDFKWTRKLIRSMWFELVFISRWHWNSMKIDPKYR